MKVATPETLGFVGTSPASMLPDFHPIIPRLTGQTKLDEAFPFDNVAPRSRELPIGDTVKLAASADNPTLEWS